MPDQNPIYDFLKSNKLTDLDEKSFVNKYSAPDKAKEIHSFFVENKLTDLDSAGFYDKYLKKKVGGEEFSPTKSPSREYLSEGQELADKGFIKTEKLDPSQLVSQYRSPDISLTPKPKKNYYSDKLEKGLIFDKEGKLYEPSSEALTKAIAPAEEIDLKKPTQKDLVEKSREAAVVEEPEAPIEKQGWLLNMVSALDKGFAKNFISSPIKGLGTVLQGATKKVMGGTGEGFVSDNLIKFGDYLNNAIDELTPQDEEFKNTLWDQAAQALGQVGSLVFTGGLTGAASKGAALVSQAPKGAVATAAKALGSQLSSPTAVSAGLSMGQAEFDRAKEAGATDDQAFEAFYKNALTGSVLETIPVMQFFKRFNNSTGGSVANYIKTKGVAGITGGIEEMTTEVLQQIYSNKTAKDIYNINQDILDGVGSSGGIGFGVGFVLNAMGANAKILRKQGREQEATVLENQVKQYEDNLENPKVTSGNKVSAKDIVTQGVEVGTQKAVKNLDRDLANNVITPEQYQEGMAFAEKAAQVANKIPETVTGESRVKSIELLVERNDINQANQNLLQQKQTTDVAYHAGIDEEIKANEERIKKLDSEVYNIAKKPSKEFGGKKYIVDGEEVSQAEFEALQGKPLGTKKIIKADATQKTISVIDERGELEFAYNVPVSDERTFITRKDYEAEVNEKVGWKSLAEKQPEVKTEVKPTEVKQPTKELAEGESVEFNTPEGNKITGERVIIPGFEKIDMVIVKEGLNNVVYDLASGTPLAEGDFTKENAIKSIKDDFESRNITQDKIYNLIYKSTNTSSFENSKNRVPQINPSSMFESYSEKRKAYDKAQYEKLPLKYTPKEIEELNKLKEKAIKNGLDKVASDIDKRIKERGTENKVNYYDVFDRTINREIEEKTKEEAKNNKVPYPKEFIKKFEKVTEETIKRTVNQGFKNDKFGKIPQDVKKILIDGYQKNIDFLNKYGYFPYFDKSDRFLTKMYHYVASLTARENREQKIAADKKELIEALDDLTKAHEKEFGKKGETEVKPKEGEVKVYNAKDLKENPKALEEDADYDTINYPKSFDVLYTSKETLNSKNLGSKKIGDVINIFNKDYVIADSPVEKNQKVKLIRVDKEGNILRRQDTKGKIEKINYRDIVNNPKIFQENRDEIVGNYYGMGSNKSSIPALNKIKREIKVGDKINWGGDYVVLEVKGDKNNPDVYLADIDKNGNLIRVEAEEIEIEETEQVTKDDLKKAEAKFAAAEDRFKKARNKIEATQVKQAGMFGGEQKGMFAMGGAEAKSTLDPLRKATKEAKAELDDIRNRIKVQEVAQPELAPVESKSDEDFVDNKIKLVKEQGRPLSEFKKGDKVSWASDFNDRWKQYSEGVIVKTGTEYEIERFSNNPMFKRFKTFRLNSGDRVIMKPSKEANYTGEENIEKKYKDVLKAKQEADKKQNRQIGAEKAAVTKEIYRRVNQMDAPADAEQVALRYLADGGTVSKEAVDEAYGSVKRAELNVKRRVSLSEEVKSKDFVQGNETLDQTAHRLWQDNKQKIPESEIKDKLMAEIGNNNSRLEAAEAYLDKYNAEYKQEKEELRLSELYKEQYLEEQAEIEKELRSPLDEQIEGEASEEHINNLINQYEAEIKGEDQQLRPESEGDVSKEAGKRKVAEKTSETELAKEYKEVVGKASKKAKENAKKEFVDRNFDNIVEKLKIQIKCPT